MSKEGKKRPVGLVGEDSDGLQGNLASLAGQIDFFESAATLVQSEPSVKKPALGVHSLTQNTTHGKIRVGPDFQAVLPPLPQPKN